MFSKVSNSQNSLLAVISKPEFKSKEVKSRKVSIICNSNIDYSGRNQKLSDIQAANEKGVDDLAEKKQFDRMGRLHLQRRLQPNASQMKIRIS